MRRPPTRRTVLLAGLATIPIVALTGADPAAATRIEPVDDPLAGCCFVGIEPMDDPAFWPIG